MKKKSALSDSDNSISGEELALRVARQLNLPPAAVLEAAKIYFDDIAQRVANSGTGRLPEFGGAEIVIKLDPDYEAVLQAKSRPEIN